MSLASLEQQHRWLTIVAIIVAASVGIGFLLPSLPVPIQALVVLAVGWVPLLATWLGNLTGSSQAGWIGVAALIGFMALVGWHCSSTARDTGKPNSSPPRWRSPAGLALASTLLSLVMVAVVAITAGVSQFATLDDGWTRSTRMHAHSDKTRSANNLHQIGLGLLAYANNHSDQLPPGALFDADGTPLHGWPTLILPYGDNADLSNLIDLNRPWNDPKMRGDQSNQIVSQIPISIYRHPGMGYVPQEIWRTACGYASNAWVIGGDRPRRIDSIRDGLSQTILLGEVADDYRPWASPVHWRDPKLGINRVASGFGSEFRGGANFAFADGSVRFLRNSMNQRVFEALCTPDGGETAPRDLD